MKVKCTAIVGFFALFFAAFCLVNVGSVSADAGSGTITGTVKFQGTAPKPTRIDMSFDQQCAKAHTSPVMTEDVVVGNDSSLEGAVVYISHGLEGQTFQPPAQPVTLEQKGCLYQPHVLALQANQKLQIVNADQTTHNIHPTPANNREWNMTQPPGTPLEQTFAREEIAIPVKCNVHPWMHGYIAVLKNPFFAVTGKDGAFEIKNLPPGNYTIQSWHGKLGMQMQQVTVSAGQSQKLDFVYK